MAHTVKNLPAVQETWIQSLGGEDALEEGMGTHSGILACRIPWAEEPGELQCIGLQRVGHDWWSNAECEGLTLHDTFTYLFLKVLMLIFFNIWIHSFTVLHFLSESRMRSFAERSYETVWSRRWWRLMCPCYSLALRSENFSYFHFVCEDQQCPWLGLLNSNTSLSP